MKQVDYSKLKSKKFSKDEKLTSCTICLCEFEENEDIIVVHPIINEL